MATKPRSPNYPAISLQKAIDLARKVYASNHLHKATSDVVARAMGYGSLNGGSLTAISALKKYGLLEDEGKELRITKDALTVLVEPAASAERARTIVKLASTPDLFAELQEAYPGSTPNEEILRAWLLRKGFLQGTVDLPIRAYRETMELVGTQKALYTQPQQDTPSREAPEKQEPEVGDLIQWEASGVLRMESPRRVRGKTEDQGTWWVFVEGSETGIPMEEAVIIERATQPERRAQKAPPTMPLQAHLTGSVSMSGDLNATEQQVASGKFGKGMSYRLLASGGEIGSKELGKIIKLLEAQKAVLDDDDGLDQ